MIKMQEAFFLHFLFDEESIFITANLCLLNYL